MALLEVYIMYVYILLKYFRCNIVRNTNYFYENRAITNIRFIEYALIL